VTRVLEGIRVLDFSRYLAGPYCATILGDHGAEVIRVEEPGGADDRRLGAFAPNGEAIRILNLGRNKKGITLNLRSPRGEELLAELVKRSDVVLHNYSPASREARLLDYDRLKEINPAIIVTCVSAFGHTGPYSHRLGFDPIAQAMSGAMSFTGFPETPPTRAAVAYVDNGTAVSAALGTMLALYHREKTGVGQKVDVSLFETAFSFAANVGVYGEYQLLGEVRRQIGNKSPHSFSDSFRAKDGWVMLAVNADGIWRRFCRAIGREDLIDDPRFKDNTLRAENRDALTPIVAGWVGERTVEEVVRIMEEARVPCGPVLDVPQATEVPQVRAREMLVEVEYPGLGPVEVPGVAIKLSRTPGKVVFRAPRVGEHNEEVYCGLLGLSREELEKLKEEGVV